MGTLPQNFRAKAALVKQLEVAYQNHRDVSIGECVLVDMAAVSSSATGFGVYQRLRDAIATRARAAGFRWIVGELSSSSTQYVCIDKLAQTIVTRIFYKDFHLRRRSSIRIDSRSRSDRVSRDGARLIPTQPRITGMRHARLRAKLLDRELFAQNTFF